MRRLQVGLTTLAAAAALTAGSHAQADSPGEFVHKRFIHGVPYERASRFDPKAALPVLIPMLESPQEAPFRSNVATTLGMIGSPEAVKALISLIERGTTRLSAAEYNARTSAVTALGLILNKQPKTSEAFAYLANGVIPANWEKTKIAWTSPFSSTAQERNLRLAQRAMIGLGYSGHRDAAKAFDSARANSKDWAAYLGGMPAAAKEALVAQARNTLEEAVSLNKRVAGEGLSKHFARIQP